MTEQSDVDYGPLQNLIGTWAGDKGLDVQSPFMHKQACTTDFRHHITAGANTLFYSETTTVDIYGTVFEHTDRNELTRQ